MPADDTARSSDRLEVIATLLLAVAAVATAWASYQATRWNGEQAKAASRTNALRVEAARAADLADSQIEVDVATFIQWVDAEASGNAELQQFYVERFRPEFQPAFDAWLATDPFTNPDAPPTPFAMPEYHPQQRDEAERLDRAAAASSATVNRNIQRASNYVLCVVLFAVSLFFAGMSTRLHRIGLRQITLALGCVIFVGTVVLLATFPVSWSV